DELEVFKSAVDQSGFIDMINDLIADFKQQDCYLNELESIIDADSHSELLAHKLRELKLIIDEYESELEGKYIDSEDYISMYVSLIRESELLDNHSAWVYGFDTLAPKSMDALIEMAKRIDVNLMVNISDFDLDINLVAAMSARADSAGVKITKEYVPDEYRAYGRETLDYLEENLFRTVSNSSETTLKMPDESTVNDEVKLIECANPFYEAESAASYIYELIRDKGYKMNDIAVICNDDSSRQPIIRRTFKEYGIPLFVDSRRTITDSMAARFIVSLLEFVLHKYRTSALFVMLKTELTSISRIDIERLENYARNYKIRGNMWTREFKYGHFDYADEEFEKLESTRSYIMEQVSKLVDIKERSGTVAEFIFGLIKILEEEWDLPVRLQAVSEAQAEEGYNEEAQNTAQSYEACVKILEQLANILGEETFDKDGFEELLQLYKKGLESVDIGIIPPALDGIIMGSMIRTRPGPLKAMVVLAANEGVLPMEPNSEGIFSVDEKKFFKEHNFPIGHLDELKMTEENVAMYRLISKPYERLYISWSLSDSEGQDCKPSSLVDAFRAALPSVKIHKDLISSGLGMSAINNPKTAMRHLLNYLKGRRSMEHTADEKKTKMITDSIISWYQNNEPQILETAMKAARDDNSADPISSEMAERLFAKSNGEFSFSPTRIESFNHCPFKHFVSYGLRPREDREFSGASREIGDMYHECIMKVSKKLEAEGLWGSISDEEIDNLVRATLTEIAGDYRDGLFTSDGREQYRLERVERVCSRVAENLAEQMRLGKVEKSYFEEEFKRGKLFAPIELEIDGKKIFIEGKIDRVDVFEGGDIRIIDYKTGSDKVSIEQMRCGYKMQLMVYMQGAKSEDRKPAGVFYYNIKDVSVSVEGAKDASEVVDSELKKGLTLNGLCIDEKDVIEEMPSTLLGSKKMIIDRDLFERIEQDVCQSIHDMSEQIIAGDVSISPTKKRTVSDNKGECTYCNYNSICRFDVTYKGNKYREIDG
ncbi:PD-(D/E)XK nuclease family protein, partial [Mogibacterium pumilum]|uniref:PD-(D/E)XK nuclease family protein n=1 Tax=Mogibacterium pumilum TaxID=86332 RepID=UPI000B925767